MSDHRNNVPPDTQAVEVDQRALVNILSRYPGTFDVLRELIQNADDAEAPSVEVHFEREVAKESQPATKLDSEPNVYKWTIKNDGSGFKEDDWEKLGKIAAGNKNSMKVGAFGVGFYSVLSKSDRPLVKSNGKLLQFERAKDGKLRKRFTDCSMDSWTSVELELQRPEPLPVLADLTKFLVSSVAFLTNIQTISVHLDSKRALCIQKQAQPPVVIEIPQHLKPTTRLQTLTVESIQRTVQRITVDAEEWVFASSSTSSSPVVDADALVERHGRSEEDHPTRTCRSVDAILKEDNAITHDLYTATIRVNLDEHSEIKKGVESTMKSLPDSFICKAVYFNSEQSLAGIDNLDSPKAKQLTRLFCGSQGIFPANASGRLFIGQSTNQTTGIGLHVAAHFLPTMERGAIDLANGQVKAWNKEVLWISGFLARIIYEEEMHITAKAKGNRATQLGLCTMDRFAFGPTAPHSGVSDILQDAFFSCCHKPKSPLPVVSDVGISCVLKEPFRQSNKELSFLKRYRVLHEEVRQCPEIIRRYTVPKFKFEDIVRDFESGAMQDAMKSLLVWWEDVHKNPPSTSKQKGAREDFCKQFASRGVLRSSNGVEIALKDIKYFTFFPLPNDLSHPNNIYLDLTLGVHTRDAVECFGWTQLPLLHWLGHVCSQARRLALNEDPGQISDVGYRILRVLVQFALVEHLSPRQWDRAAELMKDLKCVRTNKGLKSPTESYFDTVNVCGTLPVAREADFMDIPPTSVAVERRVEPKFVDREHIRNVLAGIHVRQEVDLKELIERLERNASEESNYRLLRLLATIYMQMLTRTSAFMVNPDQLLLIQLLDGLKGKKVFHSENVGRASATELLLPNEDVRELGLPTLTLPQDGISDVNQFAPILKLLGIQEYPTLDKIIAQAASGELEVRRAALQYLLSNLDPRYKTYKSDDFAEVAFIPTECGSLARPNEVFASSVWEKLGFKQVSKDLYRDHSRLGVKEDPSVDMIIKCLRSAEDTLPNLDTATTWFENLYLHGKLSTREFREQLSTIPFVPVPSSSESSPIQYLPPKDCFIKSAKTKDHHREIFAFVDFNQNGNNFLDSCCAKKSPDASDIVHRILQDPQRYLKTPGNDTNHYLDDLRTIASQLDSISEDDKQAMKKAPMFLAEENGVVTEKLLLAEQVFISDWASRDFARHVSVVPQGDTLEKMYREMGSAFLGTYVQHVVTVGDAAEDNPPFNRDQVILRISHFMEQRDTSGRTDISFDEQGSTHNLRVGSCKGITVEKMFTRPDGALADAASPGTVETKSVQVKAAFELSEDSKSYTLWIVSGSDSDLHDDIAVALCHVLLKTYRRNDMLLLASLFAMSDKSLKEYYRCAITSEVPGTPDAKVKPKDKSKNNFEFQLPLPPSVAKRFGVTRTRMTTVAKLTISAEEDMQKLITSWDELDANRDVVGTTVTSQLHPMGPKKYNNHCKQARTIRLRERSWSSICYLSPDLTTKIENLEDLRDEKTDIKFFMARGVQCQQPPRPALEEFARLISKLAYVFDLKASTACYIFWKDTDEDLMAFNRDQKYIFLNLANYHRFSHNKRVEKDIITDWYLIMAHEIAHNMTMEHDEYHGSLSASLAIKYLPTLHRKFPDISWENGQQPQSASNASN